MTNTNKGGYQILDLGNVDLTTSPTIAGLYELIEGTKKPIRLTRINLGGVEKHDVVSMPVVSGSDYVFENVYGYDLSIDSDGNLSLASTKWATRSYVDEKATKYFHPIVVNKTAGTKITFIIINDVSTAYTSVTDIFNLFLSFEGKIICVGGDIYSLNGNVSFNPAYLEKSGDSLYFTGVDAAGVLHDYSNNAIKFQVSDWSSVVDSVNAI